ncbi:MAG: hypothetical protein COV00_00530 [Candidatus Tagabacteria bacterium CG10_big_fil_rev_8_21_14_0_10_40_13]|uniref:Uncharacterized protein n=1 Tax=Candidatus Tagabacteria bacterium CG10_big_fil_rev_8_21_14_0_10_40_13 TaxID=1975022 RepID=A0A2M8L9K4_9BACT|nr:MAG: hypothetical protein COV00_00530 [Candidatus Tagabacteria bacterium CG10_big_fil_rev_8_21_14_0_10_40_13]
MFEEELPKQEQPELQVEPDKEEAEEEIETKETDDFEDLQQKTEAFESGLEEEKEHSQEKIQNELANLDKSAIELDTSEPEELESVKGEVVRIEEEKQGIVDGAEEQIRQEGYTREEEKFEKIEEPSVPSEKGEEKIEGEIGGGLKELESKKEEIEESENNKEQVKERTDEKFEERPMSQTEKEKEEEVGKETKKEGPEPTKIEDKEKIEEKPKEAELEKEEKSKEKTKKEKLPQFIKEFSKKESPEERSKLAQEIWQKRAENTGRKKEMFKREKELQEKLGEIQGLEQTVADLSDNGISRLMNYFKLRDLREQLAGEKGVYEEKQKEEIVPPDMKEPKRMLDNFYAEQKKKWENAPYTKEDITKYFSEEHLASLSLKDYALLLKRFPGEMVAHVTRQGIRDHVGMVYHTAGEGAYAEGFMKIVEDGRLRSPLGVYLIENEKEKAVTRFLQLDKFQNKEEALNYHLATLTETRQGEAGSYADRMAVHFATEEVADCYYGSEKGNEIFITYPSAHIASQYYFSGQLKESGGGYWNDQWVWANEERGMDLNAGLVFIPEEAKVDKKTGSRYELDENKNPVKNSEYQATFRKVVDSADFHNFTKQVMEITGELNQHWDEPNLSSRNQELLEKLEPFRQKLEHGFGITDRRLQHSVLDYYNLFSLDIQKRNQEEGKEDPAHSIDSDIEGALQKEGILFSEAKDTISSKEFWEARFAENPTKRPSKIVYYKGLSPTRALYEWQETQGISRKVKDKDIGFPERHIERGVPQATAGLDRFKILAEKVINNYFEPRI